MDKIFKIKKKNNKMVEIQDGSYTYGGIQTCRGHPNMKGASKHMGGVQTYGASKHMGGFQTYREVSTHMGAFKHMWASKHTGGASNITQT